MWTAPIYERWIVAAMKACVLRGRNLTAALLASVVSLAPGSVFGQTSADYASIDAVFAQYDKEFAPGCVLGIYDGGQLAYGRGYGSANLEHQVPITLDTAFYVASVSKQFTAFVIALLIARGELAPSDSVRRYLPELPEWADRVTINDLVHHTSGIRDFLTLWEISGRTFADELSVDKALELIARQNALDFPSGTQWSYTNSGYFLLAQIVHRVTGRSLSQFTHDAIFTPLGMAASDFHDDTGRIVQHRASGHAPDGAGGFRNATTSYTAVGSGGLFTTVHDLLKWDENFYDNKLGGGASLIETITTPGHLATGEAHPYAFGLFLATYRGVPIIQHAGSFIGYRAQLLRFPAQHVSIAVLCNDESANAEGLAAQVADQYLADRLAMPNQRALVPSLRAVELSSTDLRRLVGRYALQQPGLFAVVTEREDGLALRIAGPEQRLIPKSATAFSVSGSTAEVEFIVDARRVALVFSGTSFPPAPKLVVPSLSEADLSLYSGRYTSSELDTWFDIRVGGESLELRRRYQPWKPLEAIAPDRFLEGTSELRFERTDASGIRGFVLNTQRASNISFLINTSVNGTPPP